MVDAQTTTTAPTPTVLPDRFLPFDSETTPSPGETPDTDPLEEDVRRQFLDFFNSAFGAQLLRILRTLGVIVIIGGVALQASKSFRQGGGGMSQFFKGIMLPIIAGTLLVIPNILISIVGLVIAAIGWIITGLGNLI